MEAFAFLGRGAVEPLTGFVWPTPDGEEPVWVEAGAAPRDALRGYPAHDLPYWLDDELWWVELEGGRAERDHALLADRARLVGRVGTWSDSLALEFTEACARRVARQAAAALREDGRTEEAARLEGAGGLDELQVAASGIRGNGTARTLAGYTADVCFYARDAVGAAQGACIAAKMSAVALGGDVEAPGERAWQASWLTERLGL
jgi:hypothetical protein